MADQVGLQYQPYADQAPRPHRINLSTPERVVSLIGGISTIVFGVTRRASLRPLLLAVGSYLSYRAVTGYCHITSRLGLSSLPRPKPEHVTIPHEKGIRVDKSIIVNRSANDLYLYWRNLENLPRIMHHLESVTVLNGNRSHWVAKALAGTKVEWDAEIINDVPNQRIGWRSLPGAPVPNAGTVMFKPTSLGSTEVQVSLKYDPPGGPLGAVIATLFGTEPGLQIQEDLDRFRKSMESGEITASTTLAFNRDNGTTGSAG